VPFDCHSTRHHGIVLLSRQEIFDVARFVSRPTLRIVVRCVPDALPGKQRSRPLRRLRVCRDTKLGRAQLMKAVGEDTANLIEALTRITEKCECLRRENNAVRSCAVGMRGAIMSRCGKAFVVVVQLSTSRRPMK